MLPLVSPAESNWEELMITSSLTLLLRDSFFSAVSEVYLSIHKNITFPLLPIESNAIFSLIALTLCNRWFFCRTSEFKEPIEGRLLWLSADIVFTHIQIHPRFLWTCVKSPSTKWCQYHSLSGISQNKDRFSHGWSATDQDVRTSTFMSLSRKLEKSFGFPGWKGIRLEPLVLNSSNAWNNYPM